MRGTLVSRCLEPVVVKSSSQYSSRGFSIHLVCAETRRGPFAGATCSEGGGFGRLATSGAAGRGARRLAGASR
jgi:hypothetical protein